MTEGTRLFNFNLRHSDEVWLRALAERTGQSMTQVLVESVRSRCNAELAPEAFVVDQLQDFTSITLRVHTTASGDDVAEVVNAEARTEILGKALGATQPIEAIVSAEARRERGRTVVELVAAPGDFGGLPIYVATLPQGATVELTVLVDDLYPAAQAAA